MLERLALHRPDLRAWALYDFANSAFMTTVIATVFPICFQTVAAADLEPSVATARFSAASALALAVSGTVSPVLGAAADYAAVRKKLLAAFMALGVAATACMYFIERGDWQLALLLFAIGNIGISVSFVFYDFYLLALLVGTVQGGTQALSRSLFASLIPRHKASELFGFYGVFDRFGGIGGMTVFTMLVTFTGSSRQAILSVASSS